MDIFEKCNQRYIQDEVRDLGIYPYFHALESRQDTEVIMEGKRRIMLGSNNYLGLTRVRQSSKPACTPTKHSAPAAPAPVF